MLNAVNSSLRIVAGITAEHPRDILDGAADRPHAIVHAARPFMPARLTSSCVGARPTTLS